MSTAAEFDTSILQRLVDPGNPSLSPEAAKGILALKFPPADQARMHVLAEKARQGTLSNVERAEVESYERIDSLLGLLQSKARISLKKSVSNED